jgi:hypothetical protein
MYKFRAPKKFLGKATVQGQKIFSQGYSSGAPQKNFRQDYSSGQNNFLAKTIV